jgi:hypothetical protein
VIGAAELIEAKILRTLPGFWSVHLSLGKDAALKTQFLVINAPVGDTRDNY